MIHEFRPTRVAVVSGSTNVSTAPRSVDRSVAVLPFNMSDDKGNECFSDGLSEELLNLLA